MNSATVLKYGIFALVATGINLFLQWILSSLIPSETGVYMGLFTGTGAGLLTKYVLDKRYIFYYRVDSRLKDMGKFFLYTVMGIITTGIFWSFELTFHYLFEPEHMRFLGALIGLAIGYTVKYLLDKRYVFKD